MLPGKGLFAVGTRSPEAKFARKLAAEGIEVRHTPCQADEGRES